ncbi:MAG: Mov34/MPN/PAD-1 family protein [Nitrospinota bacterium]
MDSNLIILKRDYLSIFKDLLDNYPAEACGIIIGDNLNLENNLVRPCKNIQDEMIKKSPEQFSVNSSRRYYMDPKDIMNVFNEMADKKLELVGLYHSHPDADPYWSNEDHKSAMFADSDYPSYPLANNIVISVRDGKIANGAIYIWDNSSKKFEKKITIDSNGIEKRELG